MYRLGATSRPTKDVDGILRGDMGLFLPSLDAVFARNWSPLEFSRTEAKPIHVPHLLALPRRFDIKIALRGRVWRSVRVEVSPDEGDATAEQELVNLPSLDAVGLHAPATLACLALRYQIAQKVHASTDPHDPPDQLNDRARDIVDLLSLHEFAGASGSPSEAEIAEACREVFAARAGHATAAGAEPRTWPPRFIAHPHWSRDFATAAKTAGLEGVSLVDAVAELNLWLESLP